MRLPPPAAFLCFLCLLNAQAAWAAGPERFTPDPKLPADQGVPYVVITREALAAEFAPLVDWKRKTGLAAQIITLEWLEKNPHYPGDDLPERMFLLLKDLALNWKTRWVVLGGDVDIVPEQRVWNRQGECRGAFPSDTFYADVLPADLSDPDKVDSYNWNGNGNRYFGEAGKDGFDLVQEIYVGRIPAETPADAKAFIEKYFDYVKPKGKDLSFLNRAVVLGQGQFESTQKRLKAHLEQLGGPGQQVTLLIDEEPERAASEIDKGCGIFSYYGHGCSTHFGPTDKTKHRMTPAHVGGLRNAGMYPVVFGNSCCNNEFEKSDCFGETWLLKPRGGAVAYMGYSTLCYGAPVKFDFYQKLFSGDCPEVGRALAEAKRNGGSWSAQFLTLLGDPEMWVWTSAPVKLQIQDLRLAAHTPGRLTVLDGEGKPMRSARVVVEAGSQMMTAYTDPTGVARLGVPARSGSARLSIVAQNALPYETSVKIDPAPAGTCALARPAMTVDDSADGTQITGDDPGDPLAADDPAPAAGVQFRGNNRKDLNPGEVARLVFSWPPHEGASLPEGTWSLDLAGDPSVKCLTSSPRFGRETVSFVVGVDPKVLPWHQVWVTLSFQQKEQPEPWTWTFRTPVEGPSLQCVSCAVDDGEGNKDRRIGWEDAGRKIRFGLGLFNRGTSPAQGVKMTLASIDPAVKLLKSQIAMGSVPCQDLVETRDRRFEIELSGDYDGHDLAFDLAIEDERKNLWPIKLVFSVPPAPPILLKAEGGLRTAAITWVSPGVATIAGYHVYRGTNPKGSFTRLTEQPVKSAQCVDRTVRPRSAYYYTVSSVTAGGLEGRMSEPVQAQTLSPLP